MNAEIRDKAKAAILSAGTSQAEFGKTIGIDPGNLHRLLNGQIGRIPENWERILAALGLKLVAVPVGDDPPEPHET